MKTISQLFSSNKQAKWRTQIQWSAVFLVALAAVVIISAFYVNISTQTALAGRKISLSESNIQTTEHNITDLEAELASMQSVQAMEARALQLGFVPAEPGDFLYIKVPNYSPETEFSPVSKVNQTRTPTILPEYTESLIDWFLAWVQQ
ncbi:MAG: hypothetical protein ACK2TS_06150 [Anaerolineales bacterium]